MIKHANTDTQGSMPKTPEDTHTHAPHFLTSPLKLSLHFSARIVGNEEAKTGEAPETEKERE